MARNPTQRYIDNEKSKSFLTNILNQTPVGVVEEVDIDLDVEKKISELQEAKLNGKSVNAGKELKEWELGKQFANLLDNVGKEKEVVERNIVEEEKKIEGLESLLADLTAEKDKKKKKKLIVEPEKTKPVHEEVKQVILKQPEKLDLTKTKDYVAEKYVKPLEKEEVALDEEARKVVANKYSELGHGTLQSFLSPKQIESDPDIINKVESHIAEMKIANELEKDKVTSLRSIDTLEKLTREFLNFKNITSMQMSTIGGGGGVQLLDMDDVNVSTKANGYILKYNSSTERMDFVSADSGLITGLTADGSNNITITGDLTVEGTTTTIDSTTIEIQNSFKFEGATADAHETNLTTIDPTADRTISLPNATGTIVLQDTSDTLTNKSIDSDNNTITNIVNANIKSGAAIAFDKMATLTASRALVSNSDGELEVSAVTSTEIGYLDGVTSAIQTQIDANTALANTKATNAFAIAQAVALG
jgi:hypothetical protein|tara:strand:- start:28 stop:1455 length:1428 start_codon:yes stop_codon:yes gene_type:complete